MTTYRQKHATLHQRKTWAYDLARRLAQSASLEFDDFAEAVDDGRLVVTVQPDERNKPINTGDAEMKTFKATNKTFKTTDRWEGLWVQTTNSRAEDAKNPGFRQVYGTAQAVGESTVRRLAREWATREYAD